MEVKFTMRDVKVNQQIQIAKAGTVGNARIADTAHFSRIGVKQ